MLDPISHVKDLDLDSKSNKKPLKGFKKGREGERKREREETKFSLKNITLSFCSFRTESSVRKTS